MDKFEIRKATPTDLAAIWQIIQDARELLKEQGSPQWQQGYGPKETEMEESIKEGSCWVASAGGEICACAVLVIGVDPVYTAIEEGSWLEAGPYLSIHRFAVAKSQQGKGVAKMFLQQLIHQGQQQGYRDLRIDTYPANHGMIRVIKNCGFVYRGVVNFPVPHGERVAYQLVD